MYNKCMSSNNITAEVDDLVEKVFKFVNNSNCPTIEETIDCIRKAKSQIENSEEVIKTLSHSNFFTLNRIRDIFVKEYYTFKKYGLTQEWMYDLLNTLKTTDEILEVGKYKKFKEFSEELIPLYTSRLYSITPNRTIGGGEYLIRLLFASIDEIEIPSNTVGVSGDLKCRGRVYEIKGNQGRLDGACVDCLLDVISHHEEVNNGKGGTVFASKHESLVKELLGCYFNGENPYPIVAVDTEGYVIIDKELKWDGVDIGITIPKWMKIKAFNHGALVKYNDNDRTIKIVIKKGDNQ